MATLTKNHGKQDVKNVNAKSNRQALINKAKEEAEKEQVLYTNKTVTYLAEGVTGVMRRKKVLEINKLIRVERASYERAINDIFNEKNGYTEQLRLSKTQFKKRTTPRMIKDRLTNYNLRLAVNSLTNEKKGYINFTPYMVMNAIERSLREEEVNPLAVRFFDALESSDANELKAVFEEIQATEPVKEDAE